MFKEEYKKKFDSVAPDPAFRLRLEERIEDMKDNRKRKRIPHTAIIVIAAMLVLTTAGFASGTFRSIFGSVKSLFANDPAVDYEHMEEVSEKEISSQIVKFENGAQIEVKLEQSYYNGEQLALGWSACPLGETVEFFEKDDVRVENSELVAGIVDLEKNIGTENAAEFWRRLEENGWVGVAWMHSYLSDHVYLAGIPEEMGEDGYEHAPDEALFYPESFAGWLENGVNLIYEEYETPLPEAAREQESLTIARKVSAQMCWLVVDGEQVYMGREPAERVELTFEIHRSEDYAEKSYRAEKAFERFSAEFELNLTPIKAEFSVVNRVSDEWKSIWDNYGGYLHAPLNLEADVVFDYEIRVDGTQVHFETKENNGVEGMSGWFMLPEGAQSISFRPVYANSGAHADEDVTIRLN